MKFEELCEIVREHNKRKNVVRQFGDSEPLTCYVTFTEETFGKEGMPKNQRTYSFRSDNKFFIAEMLGNSIFASCVDGTDDCVRLDWYIADWEVENCYIE